MPALCAPQTLDFSEQLGVNTSGPIYELPGAVLSVFLGQLAGPEPADKFEGERFVLTAGATFSSAHLFAAAVQVNKLVNWFGEPTRNSPSFWGNIVSFDVAHTDLKFYVATSLNIVVASEVDDGDGIYSDFSVPKARADIINDNDVNLNES
jgi:hypothetical protein